MGTRYYIEVACPVCGYVDDNVYYAPTCGFVEWKCPKCNQVVDLGKYTGITYEEASSAEEIKNIINKKAVE